VKNREDINRYQTTSFDVPSQRTEGELSRATAGAARSAGSMIWKAIKTILFVVMFTGIIVFISVAAYILSFRDTGPPPIELMSLNYTSHVYVNNAEGQAVEYMDLKGGEDRILVTYNEIPQIMIDAMIAIEDKRFWEHNGVDWLTTGKSVMQLFTADDDSGGGSTLTQQLIKNITDQKQVSILRKIKEIFMALNMEEKYSKEEILEAYLNVVNFGSNTQGVGAAAKLYFGKTIGECDIAECASIAGITQYPYLYTPLSYRDKNRERQRTVIKAMYDQELITTDEYNTAMEKSDHMVFVGWQDDEETGDDSGGDIWNWYMEAVFNDLIDDIMEVNNFSYDQAVDYIYKGGLEIYTAMDPALQEGIEALFKSEEVLPYDPEVDFGGYVMDYNGKTIAVLGGRSEKIGNRWLSNGTDTYRQTGSSIKPISVYAPALEEGLITYGTVLKDVGIPGYFANGDSGPTNFSKTYRTTMNVDKAVEMSQNAPAAWIIKDMGAQTAFDFLQSKLQFKYLDPVNDVAYAPMSLGGLTYGATVREMTAAFQIFGNAGVYNEPYTYYYVRDHEGSVIIDNRNKTGEQVMSPENATVMNKLLHKPIYGDEGTARNLLSGVDADIFGKTGTTDSNYDLWFVGGTPNFVAGIWNGYLNRNVYLEDSNTAKVMWKALCEYLLANYSADNSGYKLSENVSQQTFCRSSGYIAGGSCFNTTLGWYSNNNIPKKCNGGSDHISGPSASPSITPSTSPSVEPSPSPGESSLSSEVSDSSSGVSEPSDPTSSSLEPSPPPGPAEASESPTPTPDTTTPTPTPDTPQFLDP